MALYPSLEDMKVDQMIKAEYDEYASQQLSIASSGTSIPSAPIMISDEYGGRTEQLYPSLIGYMGLEFTDEVIKTHMPEYSMAITTLAESSSCFRVTAPLSGDSSEFKRSQVIHGIRQVILCKDNDGRVGLRVHSVNSGIFVCLVSPKSPAALAGLKFGDQILDINGSSVAGLSMDQIHKIFKNAPLNSIKVVFRNRPFERTITMHKDSSGHIGFHFKDGRVIALVKDSSAARNGLLTDHQILGINGKNVIGLKDKDIATEISKSANIVTITVIPSYIYDHMINNDYTRSTEPFPWIYDSFSVNLVIPAMNVNRLKRLELSSTFTNNVRQFLCGSTNGKQSFKIDGSLDTEFIKTTIRL